MDARAAWAAQPKPRWELVVLVILGFFGSFTAGFFMSEERMPLERLAHPQCMIWSNLSGTGPLQ
jgi:hypothetical protein